MNPSIPETMKAAAIDRFGGPAEIHMSSLPVPKLRSDQVLIRLDVAGIGVWDPYVRQGKLMPTEKEFPRIIGNDGAGTIVAVGDAVERISVGEHVYAFSMEGGFYAEYVAVNESNVARIPRGLRPDEAGALGIDGITALLGLEDQLRLRPGQSLLVFGASGGIGHIAVQLAKRMGARVLAVASERDGVKLVRRLGADTVIDGHHADAAQTSRTFAPEGLDAALVLTGGKGLDEALGTVKQRGRIAYPHGVEPEPSAPEGVELLAYDGTPTVEAFERLNRLIAAGPFHVEIGHVYRLEDAAVAHRDIEKKKHHLGKLAFRLKH